MSGIVLFVGTAGFTQDDLPEQLTLGGTQVNVTRQFPGGQVQVQTLGGFDDPITWTGEFLGEYSWDRAKAIDQYRISGQEVLIRYNDITKYGIVSKFNPSYMNNGHVPYSITITPTRSANSMASVGSIPVPSILDSMVQHAVPLPATSLPQFSTSSGTTASVSSPPKHTQPPIRKKTYVIRSGDTLWGIAHREYGNGVLWTRIQAANPGIRQRFLQIGSRIIIP